MIQRVKPCLAVVVVAVLVAGTLVADAGDGCCPTLRRLAGLSECELERLFACAPPGCCPVGHCRGRVLQLTCTRCPRLRACLTSTVWKGKNFECDGSFVNQWICGKALRSRACMGTSWYDGGPCIVVEYPPDTPIFGNTRDELREICPGLYLARLYDRCPCPKFRGYFAIEVEPCRLQCCHEPE